VHANRRGARHGDAAGVGADHSGRLTLKAIRIDPGAALAAEPGSGHNRWHPDIPPALTVEPGEEFLLETRDALDGQIGPGSGPEDVAGLDIGRVHPLTGPVYVPGAEPGDLLEVEILAVTPAGFGYTVQSPGFGFLRHEFHEPFLARWEIAGGYARSPDIPGVRIRGDAFMGTIGVAPSRELMERATRRERCLAEAGALVDLPEAASAVPADPALAAEALRTIPPRENAGNVDIKQLGAGARLLIPIGVPGALLSAGDAHFAQGDGEVCGQAIEMRATLRARVSLRPGEATGGLCFRGTLPARDETPYFATTGMCDDTAEDVTAAARSATRAMVAHLTRHYGYTREQAYTICSVAVDLHASQVVDLPNVLVSALLPLDIFD
jgi:formamidase